VLKVFISYNRQSATITKRLLDDIKQLGHTPWLDQEVSGGQLWWDRILEEIRNCDALVFVVDEESLQSLACKREYEYAADLGKSVLPILVADGVSTDVLPRHLAQHQRIDYRKRDLDCVRQLARALSALPPARPLPDPLPLAPEAPLSHLASLTTRIAGADAMTYEEQCALLIDLWRSLRVPATRVDAYSLLERLRNRPDLFKAIAEDIDELLDTHVPMPPAPSGRRRSTYTFLVVAASAGLACIGLITAFVHDKGFLIQWGASMLLVAIALYLGGRAGVILALAHARRKLPQVPEEKSPPLTK
jgi:hypothetical protein